MSYKLYDANINRQLIANACASERLRYHLNLHRSYDDPVQRVVIALARGTYIPPHYHEFNHQWESFNLIEGKVNVIIFNFRGVVTDVITLSQSTGVFGVELEPGTIHTICCASDNAVIMEIKEGPFNPEKAKVIPIWSPDEKYDTYPRRKIVNTLESIKVGQCFSSLLLPHQSDYHG